MTTKKKAAGLRNRAAFQNSNESNPKHTARRARPQRGLPASRRRIMPYDPRAEYERVVAKQRRLKGAIVHAYGLGAITLEMRGAVFARCPHWGPL